MPHVRPTAIAKRAGVRRYEWYTAMKMNLRRPFPIVLMTLAVVTAGFASAALAAYARTKTPAAVQFTGVGPGGFKLVGKTAALTLVQDDKTLTVVVPLADLTTGIALRDRHMREKYLEVGKFPDVRLAVPLASLPSPSPGAAVAGELKGMLALHGKEKEIPFKYEASCTADNVCTAKGGFTINIKEFDIAVPTYLGVTIKPDISVEAQFEATR